MRKLIIVVFMIQLVGYCPSGSAADIERTETIEKTLRFGESGTDRLIIVDNVFGSIRVKGSKGNEVRVTAHKTIEARSEKKADEAEEEVTLEILNEDDVIELYVDGPFRDKRKGGVSWRGSKKQGYKVIYDFELEIPRGCAVELNTVNEGDIVVESIDGDFDVGNVNGGIDMTGLRGSGDVYAVNGRVKLEFDTNPQRDCSVGTINGDVRLYFKPGLSADFYLKTMNGEVFTDFEVDALPGKTEKASTKNGKNVYMIARMSGIRAGRGGPEIELKTLNGDMFILSR
ncbi:MAG: hypothetical protein JSW50_15425 [Candidatus Latescibacterota bacterium]|nr:MAG: hypothetical protein JSW50_15425 [Candidatus Latescibacterota bacterium]